MTIELWIVISSAFLKTFSLSKGYISITSTS